MMLNGLDVVGDDPNLSRGRAATLTLRPALVLDLAGEPLPIRGLVEYLEGAARATDSARSPCQNIRNSHSARSTGSFLGPLYPMVLPHHRCHPKINTTWLTAPRKCPTNSARLNRSFLVTRRVNHQSQPWLATKSNQANHAEETP
jgi:hypothetical protein